MVRIGVNKMAKDYQKLANDIVKLAGGTGNIASVSHCMTRLRMNLVDENKFDTEGIKALPGVLSVIVNNGEHQVVIGQDWC